MSVDSHPFSAPGANSGVGFIDAQHDKTGLVPPKVFSQPFRLVFKKKDAETVTWVEVRTLDGLRRLAARLEPDGDLVETSRFASLEMQLWGHLAEHTGFLRYQATSTTIGAGLAPLGEATTALVEDLASMMGGDAAAIEALGDAVSLAKRACSLDGSIGVSTKSGLRAPKGPSALLDKNGVLSSEGVEFLRGMVTPDYEKMSPELKKLHRDGDIGVELMMQSEPAPYDTESLLNNKETGDVLTGDAASQIGLAVESARPTVDPAEVERLQNDFLARLGGVVDEEWLRKRIIRTHLTEIGARPIFFVDLNDLSPEQIRSTTEAIKSAVKDVDIRLVHPNDSADSSAASDRAPDATVGDDESPADHSEDPKK